MNDNASVRPGRYRHYKGKEYTVVGVARHSETLEELVVYRQDYDDHGLWARPKPMFIESVTIAGQPTPRFQRLEPCGDGAGEDAGNLLADLPRQLPHELVQILVTATDVRIERIISHGHASPQSFWYDQPRDEWVLVLRGAARLEFDDGAAELRPGDLVNIAARRKHRVDWTTPTEPTVWLAVHYGARA